ncbi:MAG: helix-turn-helix transcriptional regulator [Clostridiales bacterium]|nr:helix-turn-helix transcriptional regulator [Clostridiales bacterium]
MYKNFKKLLRENGVSSYRVSKETGISQATLSDWKRGRSIPKLDKLQKIADYFKVPIDKLINSNNL